MSAALIYCRVSTEEQQKRNADNLPTQQRKCRDYCSRVSIDVLRVFEDQESGRTQDRAGLQEMLNFCVGNRGKVSHLVVADLSRLARNVSDQGIITSRLAEMGIELVSVDEPNIDETAVGKLSANMLGSVNQFYSDVLRERVSFRMSEAVKSGRFVWRAPLGYKNTQVNGVKNLVIDAERAPLIRKAFELLATGSYAADEVLRLVNGLGLRTVKGAKVTSQSFNQMIHNPVYAGWIVSRQAKARGTFEPLISEETFNAVQLLLSGGRKLPPEKRSHRVKTNGDFPLRGFARCAACGSPMTAGWAQGRGKKYPRYWCWKKGCKKVSASREELETRFVRLLGMMQPTADLLSRLPQIAAVQWEERSKRIEDDRRMLSTRLNEYRTLNLKAVESRIKGDISTEDLKRFQGSNDHNIAEVEEALKTLDSEKATFQSLIAEAKQDVVNLAQAWQNADAGRKQEVQTGFYPEGLLYSKERGFFEPQNHKLAQQVAEMLDDLIKNGRPSSASLNHTAQLRTLLSKLCSVPAEPRQDVSLKLV